MPNSPSPGAAANNNANANAPREPRANEIKTRGARPGWQSPAKSRRVIPAIPCHHLGRLGAALDIHTRDVDEEWICTCGQVFTVVFNAGGKKILRMQAEVVRVEEPSAAESQVVDPPSDEVAEAPVVLEPEENPSA